MTQAPDLEQRWQEVLDEHRQLEHDLKHLIEWAASGPPRARDWGSELARRTTTAVKDVEKHFAGEAEEELFREMEARTPHLANKLMALRKEHGTILTELRAVAEEAVGASGKAADRLAARVRAVIALLHRHEAEETELIWRSVYEDYGAGD